MEVDLEDMRSANRILDAIGRGGALKLHLPSAKFPLRYLAGAQTLISLSGMGSGIPNRNKATRSRTDAGFTLNEFYEPGVFHRVEIREIRGPAA